VRLSKLSRLESDIDPWRYVCPNCGSLNVALRSSKQIEKNLEVPFSGYGVQFRKRKQKCGFYCEECQTQIPTLYDKKKGIEIWSVR